MRGRRSRLPIALLLLGGLGLPACVDAQGGVPTTLEGAEEALRGGRYEAAIPAFELLVRSGVGGGGAVPDPGGLRAYRGGIRALSEVGRYGDALALARQGAPVHPELAVEVGELHLRLGGWEDAEEALRGSAGPDHPERLPALAALARLLELRGERDAAAPVWEELARAYRSGRLTRARDLTAAGMAFERLGVRDPSLFREALRAYDDAAAADPDHPEPRLRLGELFLAKYNGTDARAAFEELLSVNPRNARALLGRARALDFARGPGALETVLEALAIHGSLVEARVFLGGLRLGMEDVEGARAEAEAALEVNPRALDALALLASAHRLAGDAAASEATRARARALSPRDPGLPLALAEASVNTRRYADAIALAREAVALDSLSWSGWGLLALNQLRMGEMEEGRANLERAFRGDPFNVWFKNTLDLLDSLERYEEHTVGPFTLVVRADEAPLLVPLVTQVAEEAWADLTRRYGVSPDVPVRIELYPNSADFSVRTVGLTGIGALGVAFGRVLAMDSPSARPAGEFNWASTLWHELAHVVHLALSRSAMPRWFGEGLAVREQRRGRPGWGPGVGPGFLRAFVEGRLPPVSGLNRSFVRPAYPEEIGHAYLLSSFVCDYIAELRGDEALAAMLEGWGRGLSTDEVVRTVLALEPEELDAGFDAYMRERFAGALASETDFRGEMLRGTALFEAGERAAAIAPLERARMLFPEYGGGDGPDWMLARIHRESGDPVREREALERLMARNEMHLEGAQALARVLDEVGDAEGASRALERAVEIHPFDPALHQARGEVEMALARTDRAVTARRAVLALNPVDRAGAHYELARALAAASDPAGARRELLRALEIAPAWAEAQEMLLELRGRQE